MSRLNSGFLMKPPLLAPEYGECGDEADLVVELAV